MKKEFLLWVIVIGALALMTPTLKAEATSSVDCFGIKRIDGRKEAPAFSLKDLSGNQVALSQYMGRPVLLFFWASYCGSCKEDIVPFEKFCLRESNQFDVLTLVIDGEKEKRVKKCVEKFKITLPVLLDVKEKIARSYGVWMIPTVFLINREGRMEGMIVGQRDWGGSTALPAVKELLNLR